MSSILVSGVMGVSMPSGRDAATMVASLAVREFIDWARNLQCVIDLMGPADCAVLG